MSLRESLTSLWGRRSPEQQLVGAARAGDRRAFDTLTAIHRSVLYGFIVRRVGADAADDVLQECLIAAWSSISSFRGKSRFKAWLFRIALYKCADHHRGKAAHPVNSLDDGLAENLIGERDPFAATDSKIAVRRELDQLPDAQREILELYYFADLTLAEIAEAVGRNLNTVKYQFYKAHANVAEGLQDSKSGEKSRQPQSKEGVKQ